jgi:signal transduction histidine kinase
VRIRVTDTGIGIKECDLPHLFKAFNQIDTGLTRQHDGTGLGLAICSRLADLLGGEMSVQSRFGVGSEFCFTVPLRRQEPTR